MADGGGDDVGLVLEVIFLLGKGSHARRSSESAGEVSSHTGLFGDDECLGHRGIELGTKNARSQ